MGAGLDEQLAALASLSTAQLRQEWQRMLAQPAPPLSPTLLELGIAWELQARQHGRLPLAVSRQIQNLRKQLKRNGNVAPSGEASLKPGTRLSRDWHGRTYHVLVLEEGFLFEDRHYRSLTQIASAITGAAWSGPRFFGLKQRRAAREPQHG
jgi:hypothetical protein